MKFAKQNAYNKQVKDGFDILEYCHPDKHTFPLDGAVATINGAEYPSKINHGFFELFYVLEGTLTIEISGERVVLEAGDMYIIEPEKEHKTSAKYAKFFIVCTPPFKIENCEFTGKDFCSE